MTDDVPDLDDATIRAALDQCLTLADIELAMGWSAGTALRQRWRPEPVGLPEPDHFVGRTPLWFRSTIRAWQQTRPGAGNRPAGEPRARDRREVPPPMAGYRVADDGTAIPAGTAVIAFVHGAWRPVTVHRHNRRSLDVRYQLDDEPGQPEHAQRVGINRVAIPVNTEEP